MAKKKAITWTNERRKLSDLIPWEHNPRIIKNKQAERLVDSVETFGQVETLAIDPQNSVLNGHQRLSVLAGQYGMDYEVDVRVASRPLTERERQQLTVYLHKGAAGEWDMDMLANFFEVDDLLTWGFEPYELGMEGDGVDYKELWQGMPEFEQEDNGAIHSIKVNFATEEDIAAFEKMVGQTVTDKTKFIWYPKKENENLKLYRVQNDES